MPASLSLNSQAPRLSSTLSRLARVSPALGLVGSRGLAMIAQVGVQIAVGALSGPFGLGILQLFMAWSSVLGEVLARGWPSIVLKRVSIAWSRNEQRTGRAVLDRALRAVIRGWPVGLAVGAALFIALNLFSDNIEILEAAWMLPVLLITAVIFALSRVCSEALKGADAPLAAITIENIVPPVVLLSLCLVCFMVGVTPTAGMLVMGGALGLTVGAMWIGRSVIRRLGEVNNASLRTGKWDDLPERRALWFSSVQGIAFLQIPFLVLPLFTDTETIGIYAVAHKLVNIITTLLILLASVFGPAFARAAADGNRDRLRQLLARTQWLSIALFAPAAGFLLLTADSIAGVFHVPSLDLRIFMFILVMGQLINATTGLSGILLNLTGAARTEWRISITALCVALLFSVPIGGHFGATGLAILFSVVLALKNAASWLAARRHITNGVISQ